VLRGPRQPTPCSACPKSDDGKPHPEKELDARQRAAVYYHQLCGEDQTGLVPRDLLVVHHNALIRQALAAATEARRRRETRADWIPLLHVILGGKRA